MLHGVTQARSAITRRPSTPAWDGKERSLNWPLHSARYFQSLKKDYLMSQWPFGRSAFAARAAADAARRENTKPLQRPSET